MKNKDNVCTIELNNIILILKKQWINFLLKKTWMFREYLHEHPALLLICKSRHHMYSKVIESICLQHSSYEFKASLLGYHVPKQRDSRAHTGILTHSHRHTHTLLLIYRIHVLLFATFLINFLLKRRVVTLVGIHTKSHQWTFMSIFIDCCPYI